jgi:hypothetical protein
MAEIVASVAVEISGDTDPLKRALASAGGAVEDFGAKSEQAAKTLEARIGAAADSAGAAIEKWTKRVALAAAATATAMITSGLQTADAVAKQSRAMDASVEGLRSLERAAGRAGVSQSDLTSAAAKLNREIGRAAQGIGPAVAGLDALGLSARDLVALDVDERFAALSDAMRESGMSAADMGAALMSLGIEQASLINLMRDGGDAIRQSRDAVVSYGAALDDIQTAQIEAANDAFGELLIIQRSISEEMAAKFAPTLKAASDGLARMVVDAGGAGAVLDKIASAAQIAGTAIAMFLGGRAVGAMAAYVAGAYASAQASLAAAAAAGGLAARSTAAAGAVLTLNAALSASRGILRVIGGPAGLIAAAAIGLGIFAARSGNAATNAEQFRERLSAMRGDMEAMRRADLAATIRDIDTRMKELQATASKRVTIFSLADGNEERRKAEQELGDLRRLRREFEGEMSRPIPTAGGGGDPAPSTGGATMDTSELDAIRDMLKSREQLEEDAHVARLAKLREYESERVITEGEFLDMSKGLAEQHEQRLAEIRSQDPSEVYRARLQQQLEQMDEAAMTIEAREAEQYQSRQDQLDEFLLNGLITDEDYLSRKAAMEQAYAEQTAAREKAIADKKAADETARQRKNLADTSKYLGMMSSLMGSHSRRAFEVGKAAAIAEAIVSTYAGAAKALKDYPMPWSFAAAAAVVANGMMQVQRIRSTTFGGGGGGGGGGSAPSIPSDLGGTATPSTAQGVASQAGTGAAAAPQMAVLTVRGLDASALFTGQAVADLAQELLDYQRRGGQVVLA